MFGSDWTAATLSIVCTPSVEPFSLNGFKLLQATPGLMKLRLELTGNRSEGNFDFRQGPGVHYRPFSPKVL